MRWREPIRLICVSGLSRRLRPARAAGRRQRVRGQRRQRGEVVAAVRATAAGGPADGWQRPCALAGERDWLLARLEEKPDMTLRALVASCASAAWW